MYKKRILFSLTTLFLLMNVVAFFHAYQFTHFAEDKTLKTKDPKELSTLQKIATLAFGIDNPRPFNTITPAQPYETIHLQSNKQIECWLIKAAQPKGTVILFHGYSGKKSTLLDKSAVFNKLGFNTLLVDFMGSGGSEGNQTTLGYLEAEEVKTAFEFVVRQGEQKIYLFGTSMGAVAILKALHDYPLNPQGIIIECPFGSMYQTTCARFHTMKIPAFPMAGLLVFWGGIQNGFWAFGHQPGEYARSISCPTLLMYGGLDDKVSKSEIDEIFQHLKGKKFLKVYPLAGHENYLLKYQDEWTRDVNSIVNYQLSIVN